MDTCSNAEVHPVCATDIHVCVPCLLLSVFQYIWQQSYSYCAFAYVASDCDSPSRTRAELQQLLEFNAAELSGDGLQASETVADSEIGGTLVSGNRLFEPHNIGQQHYSSMRHGNHPHMV